MTREQNLELALRMSQVVTQEGLAEDRSPAAYRVYLEEIGKIIATGLEQPK